MRSQKRMIKLLVRDIAEKKGINPSKLSRMSDVHYNTLQTIWKNPYHNVSMQTLERIARALNCNVTDLFVTVDD